MIVDAHHHLWNPAARRHAWLDGLPAIRRPYTLADFRAAAAAEGVTASVLVQVLASAAETEEFLALAAASARGGPPVILGVVGWADLTRPGIGDELDRLHGLPGRLAPAEMDAVFGGNAVTAYRLPGLADMIPGTGG